jgi:hypothetical protein
MSEQHRTLHAFRFIDVQHFKLLANWRLHFLTAFVFR